MMDDHCFWLFLVDKLIATFEAIIALFKRRKDIMPKQRNVSILSYLLEEF